MIQVDKSRYRLRGILTVAQRSFRHVWIVAALRNRDKAAIEARMWRWRRAHHLCTEVQTCHRSQGTDARGDAGHPTLRARAKGSR
eukprot:5732248-Pleurochrysis_carterae.AAC.1